MITRFARPRFAAPAAVVVMLVGGRDARAEAPASASASIDYGAPHDCPRGDAFAAELYARAPQARLVAPGPDVRALVVRITARGATYAGRLTVREPDGTETERAVAGETCPSVIAALAVIASVAMSPSGAAPQAAPAPSRAAEPAPVASSTPPPSSTAAPAPAPSPAREREREETLPERPIAARRADEGRWTIALGAHGGVVSGVSRAPLVLVPLFLDAALQTASVFAPSARLRVERTGSGTVGADATSARAQLTWTAASLDLCPVALRADRLDARPCARLEGGTLEATGLDVHPSRSGVRPWLAAGPVVRGRIMLAGPVFAELEAAMNVPFIRDRFFVEPSTTLFRPAAIGWTATAGAGIAFAR